MHVIVDKIPDSQGLSEWAKALISASIGAVFGIGSSLGMEYAKPYIAVQLAKRTVAAQLAAELTGNLSAIEAARRVVEDAKQKSEAVREVALTSVKVMLGLTAYDRYDFHFASDKAVVYELDYTKSLAAFCDIARTALAPAVEKGNFIETERLLHMAAVLGNNYFRSKNLVFKPNDIVMEGVYKQMALGVEGPAPEAPSGPTI